MVAVRPTDLGKGCAGAPMQGSTRYSRARGMKLTRYNLGLNLDTGMNKGRKPKADEAPAAMPTLRQLLGLDPREVPALIGPEFPPPPAPGEPVGTSPGSRQGTRKDHPASEEGQE
eukprot:10153890-Heterocapsa_arctica.AAC.1